MEQDQLSELTCEDQGSAAKGQIDNDVEDGVGFGKSGLV
jgi:hypothetical protein